MNTLIVGGAILAALILASMASAKEPEISDPNTVQFTVTVRPEQRPLRRAEFDSLWIHVQCDKNWSCIVGRHTICGVASPDNGRECKNSD